MPLNVNEIYPSRYLSANDLKGPRVVLITGAAMETLGQGNEAKEKLVLSLATPKGEPLQKKFVAGKLVSRAIAGILGVTDAVSWAGKQIELRPESTNVGGKLMPCIRPYPAPKAGAFDDLANDVPF